MPANNHHRESVPRLPSPAAYRWTLLPDTTWLYQIISCISCLLLENKDNNFLPFLLCLPLPIVYRQKVALIPLDAEPPLPLPRQGPLTSQSSIVLRSPIWYSSLITLWNLHVYITIGPLATQPTQTSTKHDLPPSHDHRLWPCTYTKGAIMFHDVEAFHSRTPDSSKSRNPIRGLTVASPLSYALDVTFL